MILPKIRDGTKFDAIFITSVLLSIILMKAILPSNYTKLALIIFCILAGFLLFFQVVMDDAFIRLAETSLLALYKPIWNNYVDGFGNNAPGSGREASKRSRWDTLHGGRTQAVVHGDRGETRDQLMAEITHELASTNYDIPETLINAVGQSIRATPMNIDDVVNSDAPASPFEEA